MINSVSMEENIIRILVSYSSSLKHSFHQQIILTATVCQTHSEQRYIVVHVIVTSPAPYLFTGLSKNLTKTRLCSCQNKITFLITIRRKTYFSFLKLEYNHQTFGLLGLSVHDKRQFPTYDVCHRNLHSFSRYSVLTSRER